MFERASAKCRERDVLPARRLCRFIMTEGTKTLLVSEARRFIASDCGGLPKGWRGSVDRGILQLRLVDECHGLNHGPGGSLFMVFGIAIALLTAVTPIGVSGGTMSQGVEVVSGEFGTLGRPVKQDITAKLQQLCGSSGASCSVFCSETSFGLFALGRKPLCRVTYRCPDRSTRSVEAAREELILLQCASEAPDARSVVAPATELQPPPYASPSAGR